jgi:hypothetical protein
MSFISSFLQSLSLSDSTGGGDPTDDKQLPGTAPNSATSSSSATAPSASLSPTSLAPSSDSAASSPSSSVPSSSPTVADGSIPAAAPTVSSSASSPPDVPDGFVFACSLQSLPPNGRRCLSLNSRAVVVYRVRPKVSCCSQDALSTRRCLWLTAAGACLSCPPVRRLVSFGSCRLLQRRGQRQERAAHARRHLLPHGSPRSRSLTAKAVALTACRAVASPHVRQCCPVYG